MLEMITLVAYFIIGGVVAVYTTVRASNYLYKADPNLADAGVGVIAGLAWPITLFLFALAEVARRAKARP